MTTERRCPDCSSLVRPDAEWCSLCHADLRTEEQKAAARPAPEWAEPALDPEPAPEVAAPDPTAELAAAATPRGRHARPPGTAQTSEPADGAGSPVAGPVLTHPAVGLGAGSTSAMTADADAALAKAGVDVQSMLSLLAAGEPDALSPITGRLSSKGSRAVAAAVATVALIAVAILTMFVIGSFIH